jgi:hypothetical protein
MFRKLSIGLLLFVSANCVSSQNIIHGLIKEAETNKPLPFANIYIEGT